MTVLLVVVFHSFSNLLNCAATASIRGVYVYNRYDRWPEVALISVACAYFSRENVEAVEANDENSDVGEKVNSLI